MQERRHRMPIRGPIITERPWSYTKRLTAPKSLQQLMNDVYIGRSHAPQPLGPGRHKLPTDLLLENVWRVSNHSSIGKIFLGNNSPLELKQF